jgi:hypothetical protein
MTWDEIVSFARDLPEVEEGTAYGTPALRVRGRFLGRLREDGETFVIRCDLDERPLLVEQHAELFVTPHYEDYPMVLVSLATADPQLVRELVEDAWAERAPKRVVTSWLAATREETS